MRKFFFTILNDVEKSTILRKKVIFFNWWLIELPMWLTDGFLITFFGRWRGAVRIHVSHVHTHESHTANVQGGGGGFRRAKHRKNSKSSENLKFTVKVAGSIIGHVGSCKWQPS